MGPEELSAAVAMELLYFYALAHQTSFDVRWIKSRSISELIIAPMADSLLSQQLRAVAKGEDELVEPLDALTVRGGSRVTKVEMDSGGLVQSVICVGADGAETTLPVDACVLALGSRGMKAVISGSPALARASPELSAAASMPSIDVIAIRIWLDRVVETRTPANVLSRFPALRGAGGTFFMLDQLQDEEPALLWGADTPQGSVLACDFYNAGGLIPLSDTDLVDLLMNELLPSAVPAFAQAHVVDSHVARYPGAVTWFLPGSFSRRPPLQTPVSNLVCAGDWVRMGDQEHGAKGLCQERAYVSGLEAANALARSGVLGTKHGREHVVIPIRKDEPQVRAGRQLNRRFMEVLRPLGLSSPWIR